MSDAILVRPKPVPPLDRGLAAARDLAVDFFILLAAYLVASYMRRELPFGRNVGTNYEWHTTGIYLTLVLAVAGTYLASMLLVPARRRGSASRFYTAIGSIVIAGIALTAFVPRQSALEKIYFAMSGLLLVALVVPWPSSGRSTYDRQPFTVWLSRLWANRALLRIWVQYNVRSRYSQAFLGILWIALLPLSTAFVLSAVFSHIMRIQTGNVPYIAFFLAGFVPFGLFNQSVAASMRAIIGSMALINQIYFPREIIVIAALCEAAVDAFFMFVAMVVIDAIVGVYPTVYWLLLPLLAIIEITLCLGVMLIVSWLSVLVRDVPQLVTVVLQMLFYLSPVIYPIQIIPQHYRFLVTLNPIGVLIEAFHRVLVYNTGPDWSSLVYPSALGVALLVFGYRLFKTNEDRMADMV